MAEMTKQGEDVVSRLTGGQRFKARMVRSVMPGVRRRRVVDADATDADNWGEDEDLENYLEAYDCRPPPFFIPLITLAEVSFNSPVVHNLKSVALMLRHN